MLGLRHSRRMLAACPWKRSLPPPCPKSPSFFGSARMSHTQALIDSLTGSAKMIPAKGDNISLLETPSDFYEALKDGVRHARERVVMASLYIGTGKLEAELLDVVVDALADNPGLHVTMLLDALRATRFSNDSIDPRFTSSAAMISCVLLSDSAKWRKTMSARDGERVKVALYCTPNLTRTLRWLLPARVNEVVGVCHLKAFVFDNDVLMTGANLNSTYFTNRQDRYIWFRDCPLLAEHICTLIDTVTTYSFALGPDKKLWPSAISSMGNRALRENMASSVQRLLPSLPVPSYRLSETHVGCDTWLFPTVQMGPLGIQQDVDCTLALLGVVPAGTLFQLSSAYFNLTPEYESKLLQAAEESHVEILTASPQANGFYGSAGLSSFIPFAYSLLEQSLYERAQQMGSRGALHSSETNRDLEQYSSNHKGSLSIYEYEKGGWTFHSKGLWCTLPGDKHGPTVTLIGSSNFGYRSRDRDLEAQIFLITNNSRLSEKLKIERDALYARAMKVDASSFLKPERAVGPMASIACQLVRRWL